MPHGEPFVRAALCALAMSSVAPVAAFAAPQPKPWGIPDNVRIVQPAPVDGERTFASIGAALDSISANGPENRFVVKVMPGRWVESVELKPYVSLEGSGAESTMLVAPDGAPAGYAVAAGTETRMSSLTVAAGTTDAVLVREGASVRITDATLSMAPRGYGSALRSEPGARVELDRVRVVLAGGTPAAGDVALHVMRGAALVVRRSTFDIHATQGNVFVTILNDGTPTEVSDSTFDLVADSGEIEVVDGVQNVTKLHRCTMRVTDADPAATGFYAMSGAFEIVDSTLVATGRALWAARLYAPTTIQRSTLTSGHGGLQVAGDTSVMSSVVGGPEAGIDASAGQRFRIASSQIAGAIVDPAGVGRVTGCVDANFDPIQDR